MIRCGSMCTRQNSVDIEFIFFLCNEQYGYQDETENQYLGEEISVFSHDIVSMIRDTRTIGLGMSCIHMSICLKHRISIR